MRGNFDEDFSVVVFHSCVFMMLYFMTFLLLKYSIKKSICLCVAATAISMVFEIIRIYFVFDAPIPKLITTCMNIIILQGTALLLSEKKNAYALFIGLCKFCAGGEYFILRRFCGFLLSACRNGSMHIREYGCFLFYGRYDSGNLPEYA